MGNNARAQYKVERRSAPQDWVAEIAEQDRIEAATSDTDVQVYSQDGRHVEAVISETQVALCLNAGYVRRLRSGKLVITARGLQELMSAEVAGEVE